MKKANGAHQNPKNSASFATSQQILLRHNVNSSDTNFDNFQNKNTLHQMGEAHLIDLHQNPRPNLEYISSLASSAITTNKPLSQPLKIQENRKNPLKENVPVLTMSHEKAESKSMGLTGYPVITLIQAKTKESTNFNRSNQDNKDCSRQIFSEQRVVSRNQNGNGRQIQHETYNHAPDFTNFGQREVQRVETEETNYDMSDDESIHEFDSFGTRYRRKPNLLIVIEERRMTYGRL